MEKRQHAHAFNVNCVWCANRAKNYALAHASNNREAGVIWLFIRSWSASIVREQQVSKAVMDEIWSIEACSQSERAWRVRGFTFDKWNPSSRSQLSPETYKDFYVTVILSYKVWYWQWRFGSAMGVMEQYVGLRVWIHEQMCVFMRVLEQETTFHCVKALARQKRTQKFCKTTDHKCKRQRHWSWLQQIFRRASCEGSQRYLDSKKMCNFHLQNSSTTAWVSLAT